MLLLLMLIPIRRMSQSLMFLMLMMSLSLMNVILLMSLLWDDESLTFFDLKSLVSLSVMEFVRWLGLSLDL